MKESTLAALVSQVCHWCGHGNDVVSAVSSPPILVADLHKFINTHLTKASTKNGEGVAPGRGKSTGWSRCVPVVTVAPPQQPRGYDCAVPCAAKRICTPHPGRVAGKRNQLHSGRKFCRRIV